MNVKILAVAFGLLALSGCAAFDRIPMGADSTASRRNVPMNTGPYDSRSGAGGIHGPSAY